MLRLGVPTGVDSLWTKKKVSFFKISVISLVLINGFSCNFCCFRDFFVLFFGEKIDFSAIWTLILVKIRPLATNSGFLNVPDGQLTDIDVNLWIQKKDNCGIIVQLSKDLMELTCVQTLSFPKSFGWDYKPRSKTQTCLFHQMQSRVFATPSPQDLWTIGL